MIYNLRTGLLFLLCLSVFFVITYRSGEAAYEWQLGENSRLTLGGHIKSLNLIRKQPPTDNYRGFSDTRIRFDINLSLSKSIKVACSQTADLLIGDQLQSVSRRSPFDAVNLDITPVEEETAVLRLHPDRLYIGWESDKYSLIIGRQAIGFGNLRGFSPLDLIAPFDPLALEQDIRPGVDAAKIEYYGSPFSTISAVAVTAKKPDLRSYLLLYSVIGEKGDFNLLLGDNQKKAALGFGYSQDVKGMVVRAETLFFGGERNGNNSAYTNIGLEVDYRFRNNLYLDLEFFYNGDGAKDPKDYNLQNLESFFPGRYYAILNSSYELTPLLTASLAAIANLQDDSQFISPRFVYSISDNSQVLAFVDLTVGKPPTGFGAFRSQYGSAPHGGGLFLKLFF